MEVRHLYFSDQNHRAKLFHLSYIGYHKDRGAFAEYLVTDGELVISLPDNLAFEDAATLGVAGFTTCQMLWQSQSLASPSNPVTSPTPVSDTMRFDFVPTSNLYILLR
jgi:hypothetical protein